MRGGTVAVATPEESEDFTRDDAVFTRTSERMRLRHPGQTGMAMVNHALSQVSGVEAGSHVRVKNHPFGVADTHASRGCDRRTTTLPTGTPASRAMTGHLTWSRQKTRGPASLSVS